MARVPNLKRITVEDFSPEERPLVSKLAFIINSFHEQVRNALNGNLDATNFAREIKTLRFITGENGQPLNTLTFRSNLTRNVIGINILRVTILSNNQSFPTQMPLISFSQNNNIITINNITGLENETEYQIVLETIT